MPNPKAQSKLVTGQASSRKPKRQSHDPDFWVVWQNEGGFSLQPGKKDWQDRLVQSTKVPCCAEIAVIKAGVQASPEDCDQIEHITVEYRKDSGEHVTTWHIDLTEAEYQSFKEIERPDLAAVAVEPLPSPALDGATLSPPLSP